MKISKNIEEIQEPVIPVIRNMIMANLGTISLGQGFVFYPPPPGVFETMATIKDSSEDINFYGSVGGAASLVKVLEDKVKTENNIALLEGVNRVMVSAGANMAFFNILLSIADIGDEIILFSPYYFNYEMAVNMIGCKAIIVPVGKNNHPVPELIKKAITKKTKALVTISPNNPTGAVYPEELLRQINKICNEKNIYHISDEAYEHFIYDEKKHFSPGSIRGSEGITISIFTVSKSYGMAGWRIGYCVIPEQLVNSFRKIQDTNLICPPVISQCAALSALQTGKVYCQDKLLQINDNRKKAINCLSDIEDKIEFNIPEGAIYFYLKIKTELPPMALVGKLIGKYKVAVIPGSAFGSGVGCFIRLGFGTLPKDQFNDGIERFCRGIKDIV